MKTSLQFPLRTESENRYRRGHWAVGAARTAKQRAIVRLCLTQIDRPPPVLDGGVENAFVVTLVRVFTGELDRHDNLRGALKGVVDEVAAWLGLDDRSRRIEWRYEQMICERGKAAVRIDVTDLRAGPDSFRVLGAAPRDLRPPRGERLRTSTTSPRPRKAAPLEQARLAFAPCFAALPWEQSGPRPVLARLRLEADDGLPPRQITVRDPSAGEVVLMRSWFRHARTGTCWLYTEDETGQAAPVEKGVGR